MSLTEPPSVAEANASTAPSLADFLRTVITTTEPGWFVLASSSSEESDDDRSSWREQWFRWPDELPQIIDAAAQYATARNVYFSPYIFDSRASKKRHVVAAGTRTIAADLDEANVLTLPIKPTVLVQTSTGRHQGYWLLNEPAPSLVEHEKLSRRLTYAIPRCDHSGWPLAKKLRVPTTLNYKYNPPGYVRVVDFDRERSYRAIDIERLPLPEALNGSSGSASKLISFDPDAAPDSDVDVDSDDEWVRRALEVDEGPQELLASIRRNLPPRVIAQYNIQAHDRSAALWALMTSAFRAGLDRERVFHLARHSANNKFAENRYGGTRDLARDVVRAEQASQSRSTDIKQRIVEARRFPGSRTERHQFIGKLAKEYLAEVGQFVSCNDGQQYYIMNDQGRPVPISQRSESLYNLLDTVLGINATNPEARFVAADLAAYASDLPPTGTTVSLSYYDPDTQSLLFHTGRKEVLLITADQVKVATNGYGGIVFPWSTGSETIYPKTDPSRTEPWSDSLFRGCFDNVVNMTPKQASSMLRIWLLTVLFRNGLVARPLLAAMGQPGSGKSTLFRRIYTFIYGRYRSLNAISTSGDFDYAVASDPIVVLDNVDTWEKWLPDRLALSAAPSELVKRKLYTDSETVTLRRQALLGITAHNPKFGREDVTDRLLMLMFERLSHFQPESDILTRIYTERDYLWGDLLADAQRVLKTPKPDPKRAPQFRVEDFARFGHWIATALGPDVEEDFRTAITSIRVDQRSFVLDEDSLLVDSIMRLVDRDAERSPGESIYRTAGQLWSMLETLSSDAHAFQRQYKDSPSLGKKIWAMQDSLREVLIAEWQYGTGTANKNYGRGSRTWMFKRKEGDDGRA